MRRMAVAFGLAVVVLVSGFAGLLIPNDTGAHMAPPTSSSLLWEETAAPAAGVVAGAGSPVADFLARQHGMTTSFDASASIPSPGAAITSYVWYFGDNTSATGVTTIHTYATPGRYFVNLTIHDTLGGYSFAHRYVSANTVSVDVRMDRFFTADCPFLAHWNLRYRTYGDVLLSNQPPCADYNPWILYTRTPSTNPSWVYSLYHFDALVTNHPGYSDLQPVFLPVFNPAASPSASSYIFANLSFQYLDNASIAYWDTTAWPVNPKYSDGFGYLVRGTVTMDLQESRRIFGVAGATPAQAQAWWYANTVYGSPAGPAEANYSVWLDQQGNGKYDIYNGFFWYFESDIADLNATVASDGTTTVRMFLDGWGYDTLQARWFYWGAQNYTRAVNAPYGQYPPLGWMPYETCWCENTTVNATLRSTMDLEFQGTSEYSFQAVGNPGTDQVLNTSDDLPGWAYGPSLMDYIPPLGSGLPGASSYPNSELRWYEAMTAPITTPGSWAYGGAFEYTTVPTRWNLSLGNSLTLVLPRGNVTWYDPVRSYWDPVHAIGVYTTFQAPVTLRMVKPFGDYFVYEPADNVLSVAAPAGFAWGSTAAPQSPAPYVELGPSMPDVTPPHTQAYPAGPSGLTGWFNGTPVTVTLSAADNQSGVASVRYRVDGDAWTAYATPFHVAGDGVHTVQYFATDFAGNVEPTETTYVRIDTTAPAFATIGPTGLFTQPVVTVTWNATDALSGMLGYSVQVDGSATVNVGTQRTYSLTFSDGIHVIRVLARDNAGNVEVGTTQFQIDTNIFSFTGPLYGIPTVLVVAAAAAAGVLMWRRRRKRAQAAAIPPGSPPAPPSGPPGGGQP